MAIQVAANTPDCEVGRVHRRWRSVGRDLVQNAVEHNQEGGHVAIARGRRWQRFSYWSSTTARGCPARP